MTGSAAAGTGRAPSAAMTYRMCVPGSEWLASPMAVWTLIPAADASPPP